MQWRIAFVVFAIRLEPVLLQHADNGTMTSCGRPMKWGLALTISNIQLGSDCQQLADSFLIAIPGSEMQWRATGVVPHIRPGTIFEQRTENGVMAIAGEVIWRGAVVVMGLVSPAGIWVYRRGALMIVRRSNMQRGLPFSIGYIGAGVVSQQNVDHGTKIVSRGDVKGGMSLRVSIIDRCAFCQQDAYTIDKPC